MEKKKNSFTGLRQVFNFSVEQNVKSKGFKLSTILVFVLFFALAFGINVIFAMTQDNEEDKDKDNVNFEESTLSKVYFMCDDFENDDFIVSIVDAVKENFKSVTFAQPSSDIVSNKKVTEEGSILIQAVIEKNDDVEDIEENEKTHAIVKFNVYISEESGVDEGDVDEFASLFVSNVNNCKYMFAGMSEAQLGLISMLEHTSPTVISAEEFDDAKSVTMMLVSLLAPMIFSFVFYFMVLTYGQSVTKLVMAEKTSKLMETLLTSVKPYGIISGKVLAMSAVGLGQMFIWVVGAVVGFITGDMVADSMNPGYTNYVLDIIKLIKEDSSVAFSAISIVLALLVFVIGFILYCVFAGMSGAIVDKIDDMSKGQLLFQAPVIIGFFVSYLGTFMQGFGANKALAIFIRLCPITAPFSLPAEIIIGSAEIWECLVSLAISIVVGIWLIMFTGKIYKGKLFNR